MRKYIIINASEVNSIDFGLVEQVSASTMRFSTDENKAIVSFVGETPPFLEGKTQYTQPEMKAIVSDVDGIWYTEINF
jgi:hypothetical protein